MCIRDRSSTGKTSVGTAVAHRLGIKLIDGDDLHPRANIIKMGEGHPLNDEDRAPWLEPVSYTHLLFQQDHSNH